MQLACWSYTAAGGRAASTPCLMSSCIDAAQVPLRFFLLAPTHGPEPSAYVRLYFEPMPLPLHSAMPGGHAACIASVHSVRTLGHKWVVTRPAIFLCQLRTHVRLENPQLSRALAPDNPCPYEHRCMLEHFYGLLASLQAQQPRNAPHCSSDAARGQASPLLTDQAALVQWRVLLRDARACRSGHCHD